MEPRHAPIGYGAADLGTTLKPGTPKTRPLTTYARTTFTVADPTAIGGVNVSVTADDGAVVYVNGTEVVRQRMNDGAVTAGTYASASVTTASARADRQLVFVPAPSSSLEPTPWPSRHTSTTGPAPR